MLVKKRTNVSAFFLSSAVMTSCMKFPWTQIGHPALILEEL